MTVDPGFEILPGAAQDILEIWEFIAADNPIAAKRVREEILDTIRTLVSFPHKGHRRTDLTLRPLRFQIVRDYLIVYAPDETPILVTAVVHGKRNPRVIADIVMERKY